jgi:transposase-like protein
MAVSREKGKIPHSEWNVIRARHASGESLASIARHYGCTAPAIRYILRRARPERATAQNGDATEPTPTKRHWLPRESPDASLTRSRRLISPELHKRITREISMFLVALDAALLGATPSSADAMHDAADRLMRAAARLLMELEQRPDTAETQPVSAQAELEPSG